MGLYQRRLLEDEVISETNTRHRIGFNEMIANAMSDKIDLIVTKSVNRFAQNTVDSLTTIRKPRKKVLRSVLRKKTSGPSTAKASFIFPDEFIHLSA